MGSVKVFIFIDNNSTITTILDEANRLAEAGTTTNYPFSITPCASLLIKITVPEPIDMRAQMTDVSSYYDDIFYDEFIPMGTFSYDSDNNEWYYYIMWRWPIVGDYNLSISFTTDTIYTVNIWEFMD